MNLKNFGRVCLAALLASAMGIAQAQTPKKKPGLVKTMSGQGYGMAGCGLGSILFGQEKGFIQIVAVTLNGTGVQTFGITSGTSNCGESGRSAQTEQFIEINKVALENDLSRGQGESLTSLSQVMECKNTTFAQNLKNKYAQTKSQSTDLTAGQLKSMAEQACHI